MCFRCLSDRHLLGYVQPSSYKPCYHYRNYPTLDHQPFNIHAFTKRASTFTINKYHKTTVADIPINTYIKTIMILCFHKLTPSLQNKLNITTTTNRILTNFIHVHSIPHLPTIYTTITKNDHIKHLSKPITTSSPSKRAIS